MNDKTSAMIVYLATIVKLVINMEINFVQVDIIVHLKQEPLMISHALLVLILKNKEHKVGNNTGFWLLSGDPDKNCSIFCCSAAIHFPHVKMVVFSDKEFINQ